MPLDQNQLDELKSELNVARKRDLNFVICLGKKPDATVMKTHRIKGTRSSASRRRRKARPQRSSRAWYASGARP